jgi:hypothetical protein
MPEIGMSGLILEASQLVVGLGAMTPAVVATDGGQARSAEPAVLKPAFVSAAR